MTFSEQTAQALIAKYNLKPNTFNVWKLRGSIPDKYADPNYAPKEALTDYDRKQQEALLNALCNPKLNKNQVCRETGIASSVIESAIRQDKRHVDLTPARLLALKKNVQELRIKIKAVIEPLQGKTRFTDSQKAALDKLLLDPRFMVRGLLGADTQTYTRHVQRHSPTSTTQVFDDSEASDMVDKLSIFLLETALQ